MQKSMNRTSNYRQSPDNEKAAQYFGEARWSLFFVDFSTSLAGSTSYTDDREPV